MVRFRLAEVLEEKGWTAYRLAQETGDALKLRAAYRLAEPDVELQRLDLDTLDVLCRVLQVTPGDLLEYMPEKKSRGK